MLALWPLIATPLTLLLKLPITVIVSPRLTPVNSFAPSTMNACVSWSFPRLVRFQALS
ncbi:MAG TPA: hypothetical protein VGI03_10315 [Verrucomicrobiae bacterium]